MRAEEGGGSKPANGCAPCLLMAWGLLCGGLEDGSIRVRNRATLGVERTLAGHTTAIFALVSVEGWLTHQRVSRPWDRDGVGRSGGGALRGDAGR